MVGSRPQACLKDQNCGFQRSAYREVAVRQYAVAEYALINVATKISSPESVTFKTTTECPALTKIVEVAVQKLELQSKLEIRQVKIRQFFAENRPLNFASEN